MHLSTKLITGDDSITMKQPVEVCMRSNSKPCWADLHSLTFAQEHWVLNRWETTEFSGNCAILWFSSYILMDWATLFLTQLLSENKQCNCLENQHQIITTENTISQKLYCPIKVLILILILTVMSQLNNQLKYFVRKK